MHSATLSKREPKFYFLKVSRIADDEMGTWANALSPDY